MTNDEWMFLQGRLLAMEALWTALAWQVAKESRHPPTTLSGILRMAEDNLAAIEAEGDVHPRAKQAMKEFIQGPAEELEKLLHRLALERASPPVRDS